ncbi:MAG: DEAD/DEAH box helicase, partial [Aeromicrobium sp.]
MATPRQRRSGGERNQPQGQRRARGPQDIMSVLARGVREVEAGAQTGRVSPTLRTKFQAVALLAREERTRAREDKTISEAQRAERLKRLDGIGTILARTAASDSSLMALLGENAVISEGAIELKRKMLTSTGAELEDEPVVVAEPTPTSRAAEKQVVPKSVVTRQLANPFVVPDFSAAESQKVQARRLASWELLGPLLSAFERSSGGASACMALPDPEEDSSVVPAGLELMLHQAQLIEAAADGHRTFLLADEPGLGKTAQALLAAQAAKAYPLLVVVPNVVKTNWAREAETWTPRHSSTVIHGDGDTIDGFADIVIINYEVLDRHVGWLGDLGFRGMVLDEAHFIKNKSSQRSQHVLELSDRIRARTARPLLMALTGTPLINDIDDFLAIWEYLGWIDSKKPRAELMHALEETGLTPVDNGFYPAARNSVIDLGIVRRRKIDVAADIPARRIADIPVELDDEAGRSIKEAERQLARRLVARYESALAT